MDNPTARNASKYINGIYDNLSYYDMYGTTIFQFIILTLFVFYVYTYYKVMKIQKEVANDWTNQRCNPKYLPFAGSTAVVLSTLISTLPRYSFKA